MREFFAYCREFAGMIPHTLGCLAWFLTGVAFALLVQFLSCHFH